MGEQVVGRRPGQRFGATTVTVLGLPAVGKMAIGLSTIGLVAVGLVACSRPEPDTTVNAVPVEEAQVTFGRSIEASARAKTVQARITGSFTTNPPQNPDDCDIVSIPQGATTALVGADKPAKRTTFADADGAPTMMVLQSSQANDTYYLAQGSTPPGWNVSKPWTTIPDTGSTDGLVPYQVLATPSLRLLSATQGLRILAPAAGPSDNEWEPDVLLAALRTQSQAVTSVGGEDLDGQPTQRLHLTIDPTTAGRSSSGTSGTVDQSVRSPTIAKADADAWVRPDGKLARVTVSVAGTSNQTEERGADTKSTGTTFEASTDVRFFAYDEPLLINIPSAAEIQSIDELAATSVFGTPAYPNPCMADLMNGFAKGAGNANPPSRDARVAFLECQQAEQRQQMGTMTVGEWRRHLVETYPAANPSSMVPPPGVAPRATTCVMAGEPREGTGPP